MAKERDQAAKSRHTDQPPDLDRTASRIGDQMAAPGTGSSWLGWDNYYRRTSKYQVTFSFPFARTRLRLPDRALVILMIS